MGGKDGEIFFPFSSQEFSSNLLFKAKSRRITFLQMEKGTLPRMEELFTQETGKKALDSVKFFSSVRNKCLLTLRGKFTMTF
jgi:hypothetical protein